jgi:glycosyltransferase involved in cell wall biosynthesis
MQTPSHPHTIADVSVIAANYNNAAFLEQFIQSVNHSSMHPKELIIVDDGSIDNSRDILNAFSHLPFLKQFFFETNKGFTAALNSALEAATGKYIMRADPDDTIHPKRIGRQFSWLEQHPEIDMLGSNATYFNSLDGRVINNSNFPLKHDEIVRTYHKGEHGLLHATVCGKAEVYKRYRYQPQTPGEDYELFARMVRDGFRFANLSESLYNVRVHPGSSTSNISYEAIARTFRFRDEIFETNTGKARIWFYYNFIRFYRNHQLSENVFAKYGNLLLAILCHPSKLLKRLFR